MTDHIRLADALRHLGLEKDGRPLAYGVLLETMGGRFAQCPTCRRGMPNWQAGDHDTCCLIARLTGVVDHEVYIKKQVIESFGRLYGYAVDI